MNFELCALSDEGSDHGNNPRHLGPSVSRPAPYPICHVTNHDLLERFTKDKCKNGSFLMKYDPNYNPDFMTQFSIHGF